MSEMEWEEAPEVYVPRVRNWLRPALKSWARGCYPPRQGVTVVWGCLFVVPWACWQALKFFIYECGVALMFVAYVVWAIAELATYRHRRKRAILAQWGSYVGELYGQDPPPQAT